MSYRLDRSAGFQPWGVTNPWVWADYGQPQRLRGYVSPVVMKTDGYYLRNHHLGQVDADARARRMEVMAAIGLTLSAVSFLLMMQRTMRQNLNRNRRRRRRRR